jgi:SAM-dependent methyltransferase
MAEMKLDYAEPEYAKKQDKNEVPYYRPNLNDRISPEVSVIFLYTTRRRFDVLIQLQELLELYSHIPRDQQSAHIHRIVSTLMPLLLATRLRLNQRDLAWDIRQYPCTGSGGWLKPQLRLLPNYPEILARAKAGGVIVDIGTFVGHDLRRLVYDGAPSNHLWGVDIVSHFDVGYELFNDRERWNGHFVEADFLTAATSPLLAPLQRNADIIVISQVLHQWTWANQLRGATALVGLTKPGSLVVGNQMGKSDAEEVVPAGFTVPLYIQSPQSFAKLWDEVGAATGTRWETEGWLRSWGHIGVDTRDSAFMGPDVGILEFTARRVV